MSARRAAVSALWLAAACASTAAYDVEVRFPSGDLRARAASVEVDVVQGGCGALGASGAAPVLPVASEMFRPGEPAPALGQVPVGRIGLYARARDATCRVFAAGCTDYDVRARGGSTLSVTLAAVDGPAGCDPGVACAAGACGQVPDADAGASDVGTVAPGDAGDVASGTDAPAACVRGTADCDGNPTNGCETDLRTSAANCGGCGRVCRTNATTPANLCMNGACTPRCLDGFDVCNGNPANGCNSDLSAPENCGGCGRRCGLFRPVCRSFQCQVR